MLLIILILMLCLAGFISIILTYFRTKVVPMPSSYIERKVTGDIIEKYCNNQNIVELGSGWGGLSRNLYIRFPHNRITGIELSLFPFLFSKILSLQHPDGPEFIRENFYNIELENNKIYITYLSGTAMKKLRKRFENDQPKGTFLISITFAMPGWTPYKTVNAPTMYNSPIYLYKLH